MYECLVAIQEVVVEGGIYNSSSTHEIQDVQDNFGKQSLSLLVKAFQ